MFRSINGEQSRRSAEPRLLVHYVRVLIQSTKTQRLEHS
jgi:hypothetical protein